MCSTGDGEYSAELDEGKNAETVPSPTTTTPSRMSAAVLDSVKAAANLVNEISSLGQPSSSDSSTGDEYDDRKEEEEEEKEERRRRNYYLIWFLTQNEQKEEIESCRSITVLKLRLWHLISTVHFRTPPFHATALLHAATAFWWCALHYLFKNLQVFTRIYYYYFILSLRCNTELIL